MAVRPLEIAKDCYGKDIRVGDVIACMSGGICLAVVVGIQERTITHGYNHGQTVRTELMIREKLHTGEMSEHLGKQKDSTSVALVPKEALNG